MKIAVRSDVGETLQTLELSPKTFKTGSRGFHGLGKVQEGGKRYQLNIIAVEIGSKPNGSGPTGSKKTKKGS